MRVGYTAAAVANLDEFSRDVQERILGKVCFYAEQKNPLRFAKHLAGYNAYRFRVGIYRVLFEIQGDTLLILKIMKRDKAYKDI